MTYRVFHNVKNAKEYPWGIHCEETNEILSATSVVGLITQETEQPTTVKGIPSYVLLYRNARIQWVGSKAIILKLT